MARFGLWFNGTLEEPFHSACAPNNGLSGWVRTQTLNAVILEWFKSNPGIPIRIAEVSFRIPGASLANWDHIAVCAAYRRPISGEPVPNVSRFGRICGDIVHGSGTSAQLVVQFNKWTDNLDSNGNPDGCDGTTNNLFNPVIIPGGLQPNHWYRLITEIVRRFDNGLNIAVRLRDDENPTLPFLTITGYQAPASCTPPWYAGTENRWAVGVTDKGSPVDTYLDNFLGFPNNP